MKIKKQIPKAVSGLLCLAFVFGSLFPAMATDTIITETPLEEVEKTDNGNTALGNDSIPKVHNEAEIFSINDDIGVQSDETRYETIEVTYSQASNYLVTIPKTISLGSDRSSSYPIRVEGDIAANKQVCVVPVDGIAETEVFDFYMSDQTAGSTKPDVAAEINQAKFYWNHEDVANGYEETENYIVAEGLSAGRWKGTFQMEISMRTDPTHIHNYVGEITKEPTCTGEGEKTYTCDCGDSYTETIDPTGHHYKNGECTDCGEKDPNHEHSYTETVTKEPTCTEEGEKTYTCTCGDSYTQPINPTGHNYVDGECSDCGDKDSSYHKHNYTETVTKEPTCTEAGEKTLTCSCGDTKTESIPATGHNYGEDDECTGCGGLNPNHKHNYSEEITKAPTCSEAGEKTLTCSCGDTKTESIPATGHSYGEDDKCTDCGILNPDHKHDYVEDINIVSWENTSNGTYAFIQDGTKWTSNSQGKPSSTATSTWMITLTEDTKYSFIYKVSSESGRDRLTIKLDDITVANAISGDGDEITYSAALTAGVHTLTVSYVKDSSVDKNDDCGYVILGNVPEGPHHVCTICGNKEVHNYVDGVCMECRKVKYNPYEVAPSNAYLNWKYTLDNENNVITLNHYIGKEENVIVYGNYVLNGITYKTQLASCGDNGTTFNSYMFGGNYFIKSIKFDTTINTGNVTNMQGMFYGCSGLTDVDVTSFDTSNVTNMKYMFMTCQALTNIDLSNFDTGNVTDMSYMFTGCQALTDLDLSNFDTGNVTDMNNLFNSCKSLANLDISNFDTSNVTDMKYMFTQCNKLADLDVSNFDTGKVTDMSYMFMNCTALANLDVSSFDTNKVTNMGYMFSGCVSLTELDVNNFDTSKVTDMSYMFASCQALTELDVSNFDTGNVTNMNDMFSFCSSLTSLDLTNFRTSRVKYMAAMFYGASKLEKIYVTSGSWVVSQATRGDMFLKCGVSSVTYK